MNTTNTQTTPAAELVECYECGVPTNVEVVAKWFGKIRCFGCDSAVKHEMADRE